MSNHLDLALERIATCRQTQSPSLDLTNLLIKELPTAVFELVWLEELNFSIQIQRFGWLRGFIHVIPNEIKQLTQLKRLIFNKQRITDLSPLQGLKQLQSLSCGGNKISDLTPVAGLSQLQSLSCWQNQISDLTPVAGLSQLQSLSCWQNQISDLTPVAGLSQLQSLSCWQNQISDLTPVAGLSQLQSLDCGDNKISDLSSIPILPSLIELNISKLKVDDLLFFGEANFPYLSKITCLQSTIKNADTLPTLLEERERKLYLAGSHINHIPSVLLGREHEDCYENLVRYYQALEQGFEWRRQLKIQLIGNGRVGKSSLAYALKHQKPAPAQMESTHGILIEAWPHIQQDTGDEITWQVWDFGGQEIYHATHRLFLSDDCVYLLVWAEDTEEQPEEINHPVSYWLEAIHDIAPHSPVILVKNQIDRADKLPAAPSDLTLQMLGADQIRQAVKVSALQYKNINSLKGTIQDVIEELKDRVYLQLPKAWLAVEAAINTLKQTEKTISFEQFEQLCQAQQIDYAEWFVDYLHKTGMLFYQPGAFQNQIILDQNWIIEAVYKVFDRKAAYRNILIKHNGKLLGAETGLIWPEATEQEREIYLGFMRDCHICYEVNTEWDTPFVEREYIIPAFLPQQCLHQVTWGAMQDKDWHYVVHYPFLHRSIIERLIVRLGETYKDQSSPWYQGIYCHTEWGQILLVCHLQDKTLSNQGCLQFSLRGASLEQLLHALRKLVKEVSPHNRYSESLQKGLRDQPTPLSEFQEEETMSSRLDAAPAKQAIQVFISYSKEDKEHRVELEKRLKLISRQFKVKAWTDAQLMAGGLVHEDIKKELVNADVVLLLISRNFLLTDYCYEVELPVALERYHAKKNVVIPIIVGSTPDWTEQTINGFKLGNITALPTKGVPLKKWGKGKQEDFWDEVQVGIKNRVVHLLES